MEKKWVVYILECGDGTLYTGVTDNLERRFDQHVRGKGAKYTRGRGPLTIRCVHPCADRGEALKKEAAIKRMPRSEKQRLCRLWQENQIKT